MIEPPCTERYARWWCAVKGTWEMMVDPSTGTESGRPVKLPSPAVVKSHGSKHRGKRL